MVSFTRQKGYYVSKDHTDEKSLSKPRNGFMRRHLKIILFSISLLIIILVLSIALPLALGHHHSSHPSTTLTPIISAVPTTPGGTTEECPCGFYITESKLLLTTQNILNPKQFLPNSTISDNLHTYGWQISNRTLNTKPVSAVYLPDHVVLTPNGTISFNLDAGSQHGYSYGAQISTINDVQYGSFRFTAKTSLVAGACQGMFYYHNDTSEIDLEVLSRYTFPDPTMTSNRSTGLQMTVQPLIAGQDDWSTNHTFPFDPTTGFHEYRFDWSMDEVNFYADSQLWGVFSGDIPQTAGRISINNWSNGNPRWTGRVPRENVVFLIQGVVMYYNTSNTDDLTAFEDRCQSARTRQVCLV